MNERVSQELEQLKTSYPNLEFIEDGLWVRIPSYKTGHAWEPNEVEVAFQIPENLPGQAPYAFHVRLDIKLKGGSSPDNYTYPVSTPWGSDWGRFSWSLEPWVATEEVGQGSNMVEFVRSFSHRLGEGK